MTETVSATNTAPTSTSSSCVPVAVATAASRPPRASEPVSPMKMRAGGALCHRKPAQPPSVAAHTIARLSGSRSDVQPNAPGLRNCQNATRTYAPNTSAEVPAARPSRPSVRLTALETPDSRTNIHTTNTTTPTSTDHSPVSDTSRSMPASVGPATATTRAIRPWPTNFADAEMPPECRLRSLT